MTNECRLYAEAVSSSAPLLTENVADTRRHGRKRKARPNRAALLVLPWAGFFAERPASYVGDLQEQHPVPLGLNRRGRGQKRQSNSGCAFQNSDLATPMIRPERGEARNAFSRASHFKCALKPGPCGALHPDITSLLEHVIK